MVLTPHILAGAALGANINNPAIIALGAITLHFILDAIPHWDYDIYDSKTKVVFKVCADMAIACLATLFLIRHISHQQQINTLIGGFFGVLPDGILLLSFIFKNSHLGRYAEFHDFWHELIVKKDGQASFVFGLATQVIIVAVSLFILKL